MEWLNYVLVGMIGFLIGSGIISVIVFKDKRDKLMNKITYLEDEARKWHSESEIANFRYTSYKQLYELQKECAELKRQIAEWENKDEEV